jgi:hypothetical protein
VRNLHVRHSKAVTCGTRTADVPHNLMPESVVLSPHTAWGLMGMWTSCCQDTQVLHCAVSLGASLRHAKAPT